MIIIINGQKNYAKNDEISYEMQSSQGKDILKITQNCRNKEKLFF